MNAIVSTQADCAASKDLPGILEALSSKTGPFDLRHYSLINVLSITPTAFSDFRSVEIRLLEPDGRSRKEGLFYNLEEASLSFQDPSPAEEFDLISVEEAEEEGVLLGQGNYQSLNKSGSSLSSLGEDEIAEVNLAFSLEGERAAEEKNKMIFSYGGDRLSLWKVSGSLGGNAAEPLFTPAPRRPGSA